MAEGRPNADPREIVVYQQAHEIRRRWEGYIWSWGILVTALVSFTAGLLIVPGRTALPSAQTSSPVELIVLEKLALILLSTFLASIFLNVYRARCLMKRLETSIRDFHARWGLAGLPVVPLELDECMPKHQTALSSTQLSVVAHFMAFAIVSAVTLYVVFWL